MKIKCKDKTHLYSREILWQAQKNHICLLFYGSLYICTGQKDRSKNKLWPFAV